MCVPVWCWCVVCVALFACGDVVVCGDTPPPPHIVVILTDDMGWNDVSFHGSSQIMTPNLDALGLQGVILNRHYTLPTCSPSRAAFLSGLYPVHTGVHTPISSGTRQALPLNLTLLPQHLRRLGYLPHLVGKWHLGSHAPEYLPTSRGFLSHLGFWNGYIGYYDGVHLEAGVAGRDARRGQQPAWHEFTGIYNTDLFTKEAVAVVRSHDVSEGPLYLQVAFSAPHTGNKGAELEVRDLAANERDFRHIPGLPRRLYAGMVRAVDDAVGDILEALRARDMLHNTIILFSSDNGAPTLDPLWNYNNHGSNWPLRGMKSSCHDGGVRSATLLWSPLVPGGRVSETLIHLTDWLPTFYSAAGGDVRDLGELDGVDQWGLLRSGNKSSLRKEVLVDLSPVTGNEALIRWPWKIVKYGSQKSVLNTHAGDSGRGPEVPLYAVDEVVGSPAAAAINLTTPANTLLALRAKASIENRCPLVVNNETTARPCIQRACLFNLLSDPCESTDVSVDYPGLVAELGRALDQYRAHVVPAVGGHMDPRAHPRLWGDYWDTWAAGAAGTAPTLPGVTFTTLVFALLLTLSNTLIS